MLNAEGKMEMGLCLLWLKALWKFLAPDRRNMQSIYPHYQGNAFVVEYIVGGAENCFSSGNLQDWISEMCSVQFGNHTWFVIQQVEMVSLYKVNYKTIDPEKKKKSSFPFNV